MNTADVRTEEAEEIDFQPMPSALLRVPPGYPPKPPILTAVASGESDDEFRMDIASIALSMRAKLHQLERRAAITNAFIKDSGNREYEREIQMAIFDFIRVELHSIVAIAKRGNAQELCAPILACVRDTLQKIEKVNPQLIPHNLSTYLDSPGILDSVASLEDFWKDVQTQREKTSPQSGYFVTKISVRRRKA